MKEMLKRITAILVILLMVVNSSLIEVISIALDKVKDAINAEKVDVVSEINLERYVNYKLEEDSGVLVALNFKTGIEYKEDQVYVPTKTSVVTIELPKINEEYPEKVEVNAISTKETNGSDVPKDWTFEYNKETGTVGIQTINGEDEFGNIYSENIENARDSYRIDLYYSENCYDANKNAKTLGVKATVIDIMANEAENQIRKELEETFDVKENISGLVSTEVQTNDIYNGVIKGNIANGTDNETVYVENSNLVIDYKEIADEITFVESNGFINKKGRKIYEDQIIYKATKINKNEVLDILGEDGYLEIQNDAGEILLTVNKETEVDENGGIQINYENEITSLVIKTSKPIKIGNISIVNAKAIKSTMLNLENNKMKTTTNIKCVNNIIEKDEETGEILKEEQKEIYAIQEENEIEIKDSETRIDLSVDNTNWTNKMQNEVMFTLALNISDLKYDLFKNPVIDIKLPEEVEKIILGDVSVLYGNGLEIGSAEVLESESNKIIRIALTGIQTNYDIDSLTEGTNVLIPADIILNKETNSTDTAITYTYSNEIVSRNDYENENKENKSIDISIESINEKQEAEDDDMVMTSGEENRRARNNNFQMTSLDVKTYAKVGNEIIKDGDIVKEQEIIKYHIEIKNNSDKTVEGISVVGQIPEGTTYATIDKGSYYAEEYKYVPDEEKDSFGISGAKIDSGKTGILEYEVIVNNLPDGETSKDIQNDIKVYISGEEKATYSLTNVVEKAELRAEMKSYIGRDRDNSFYYEMYIENLEDRDLENIHIETTEFQKEINFDFNTVSVSSCVIENIKYENKMLIVDIKKIEKGKTAGIYFNYVAENFDKNITEQDIILSANITTNNSKYRTNENIRTSYPEFITVVQTSDKEGEELKYGEEVNYEVTIKNESKVKTYVEITDYLPENLEGVTVEYDDYVIDKNDIPVIYDMEAEENLNYTREHKSIDISHREDNSADVNVSDIIPAGKELVLKIKATAGLVTEKTEISNFITVRGTVIETKISNTIKNKILKYEEEIVESDEDEIIEDEEFEEEIDDEEIDEEEIDEEETIENDESVTVSYLPEEYNSDEEDNYIDENEEAQKRTTDQTYKILRNSGIKYGNNNAIYVNNETITERNISGYVWEDIDKDGKKDGEENLLAGVKVKLFNADTYVIERDNNGKPQIITTDENGFYKFNDVKTGKYLVVFEYDTENYRLTSYNEKDVSDDQNSDAIDKIASIDGIEKKVAVTDIIIVSEYNINNIDLGLIKNIKYNFKIENYISQITVENGKGQKTYKYKNSKLAKVEVLDKEIQNTSIQVTYKIVVTNIGESSATINEIVDQIPEIMNFTSQGNENWKSSGGGVFKNVSLSGVIINPGESKEITLVLTKSLQEGSIGVIKNIAKITKSEADGNVNETDTTDNIAEVELIISLKTGVTRNIIIAVIMIAILGMCIYLFKTKQITNLVALLFIVCMSFGFVAKNEIAAANYVNINISNTTWSKPYKFVDDDGKEYTCMDSGYPQCHGGTHTYELYDEEVIDTDIEEASTTFKLEKNSNETNTLIKAYEIKERADGSIIGPRYFENGSPDGWVYDHTEIGPMVVNVEGFTQSDLIYEAKITYKQQRRDSSGNIERDENGNAIYDDKELTEGTGAGHYRVNVNFNSNTKKCKYTIIYTKPRYTSNWKLVKFTVTAQKTVEDAKVTTETKKMKYYCCAIDDIENHGSSCASTNIPGSKKKDQWTKACQRMYRLEKTTTTEDEEIEKKVKFKGSNSGGLTIIKKDKDTNNGLNGVEFEIEGINEDNEYYYKVLTTKKIGTDSGNRGRIVLDDLIPGWYKITERSVPDRYDYDFQKLEIDPINSSGSANDNGTDFVRYSYTYTDSDGDTYEYDEDDYVVYVQVRNNQNTNVVLYNRLSGNLEIEKTNQLMDPIEGAEFVIYYEDAGVKKYISENGNLEDKKLATTSSSEVRWRTDSEGKISFEGLPMPKSAGRNETINGITQRIVEYTIEERSTPYGNLDYQPDQIDLSDRDQLVYYGKKAKVEVLAGSTATKLATVETINIETTTLNLQKIAEDDGYGLSGVGFKIVYRDNLDGKEKYMRINNLSEFSFTGTPLEINKYDDIKFFKEEEKDQATTFYTGPNGYLQINNVPTGDYRILEVYNQNYGFKQEIGGERFFPISNDDNSAQKYDNTQELRDIGVRKVDQANYSITLPNVEFKLEIWQGNTKKYIQLRESSGTICKGDRKVYGSATIEKHNRGGKGDYTVRYVSNESDATIFVTTNSGGIYIDNLETYYSPEGEYEYVMSEVENQNYGYRHEPEHRYSIDYGTTYLTNEIKIGNLVINKVDQRHNEVGLPGIEFKIGIQDNGPKRYLQISNKSTGEVYNSVNKKVGSYVNIERNNNLHNNNDYHVEYVSNINDATIFVTDDSGKIYINNLEVYYSKNNRYTYSIEEFSTGTKGMDIYYDLKTNGISVINGANVADNLQLVENGTETKMITNLQKRVDLEGYVWEDIAEDNKEVNRNFLYGEGSQDSKDIRIQNIPVTLSENGNVIARTLTDANGHYEFIGKTPEYTIDLYAPGNSNVASGLAQYSIEFEYNGLKYKNVPKVNNYIMLDNSSKADENTTVRNQINTNLSSILGNGKKQTDGTTSGITSTGVNLTYTQPSEYKSALVQNTSHTAVSTQNYVSNNAASMLTNIWQGDIQNRWLNVDDRRNNTGIWKVSGLNLGIQQKEQPDMAIALDLDTVQLKFNDYIHTYTYNERFIRETQGLDIFSEVIKYNGAENYPTVYTRNVYNNYVYANGVTGEGSGNKLEFYSTYKIGVKNESSSLAMEPDEIVYYIDSNYDMDSIVSTATLPDGRIINVSWQNKGIVNDRYIELRTTSLSDVRIPSGQKADIYITVKKTDQKVLEWSREQAGFEEDTYGVAEITAYTTYENGSPYAGIDTDSAPDNIEPGLGKEHVRRYYEDDTDSAPVLKLVLDEPRTISGNVFEDITSNELKTGEERNGDGILTNDDIGRIANVKVELITGEKDYSEDTSNKTAYIYPNAVSNNNFDGELAIKTTGNDGSYTFVGVVPGKYYLKYTYGYFDGNESVIYVDGNEKDKIRTEEYKSTIITPELRNIEGNTRWYQQISGKGYSVATDDYTRRKDINNALGTIDYNLKTQYDAKNDNNAYIHTMVAASPTLEVSIENSRDEVTEQENNRQRIYNNLNFGIVERPRQSLRVDKEISKIKVVLANGNVLIDGDPRTEVMNYVTYPKGGILKMEVDNEIIQGSTLDITYKIKVVNNGELDYANEEYYKYGTNKQNLVEMRLGVIADYCDEKLSMTTLDEENYVYYRNSVENGKWNIVNSASGLNVMNQIAGIGINSDVYNSIKLRNNITVRDMAVSLKPEEATDELEVTAKKLLTDLSTTEQIFDNYVELLQVSNVDGRFYGEMIENEWKEDIPGNFNPQTDETINATTELDNNYFNRSYGTDTAKHYNARMTIVPPTGAQDIIIYVVSTIVGLIVLAGGIVTIKKFIEKSNKGM